MVTNHNGRREKIRAFLQSNPGSSAAEIAAAIGEDRHNVTREVSRLVSIKHAFAEGPGNFKRYTLASVKPPRKKREIAPKPTRHKNALPLSIKKLKPEKQSRPRPAATVEEFLAAGGKIEVLPTAWAPNSANPANCVFSTLARPGGINGQGA